MKKLGAVLLVVALALGFVLVQAPSVAASPEPGIVGLWHLDEGTGTTAYDSSGNGNDGTLSGGKFGNALDFDGSDDGVLVADSPSLDFSTAITIEAWIYLHAYTNLHGHNIQTVAEKNMAYYLNIQGGQLSFYWYGLSIPGYHQSPNTLPLNTWTHVAATYNGSFVKLYENGVEVYSAIVTGTGATSNYNLGIGYEPYKPGTFPRFFDGLIDEVRISNVARTLFDLTSPPSADGNTVALWHFDESVGSTVYDETTNDNDGTINGASWVPAGPTWTTGKFGKALRFDGNDDYVQVADSASLDVTGAITIECWVKREQSAYQTLISKWSAADDQRSYLLSLTAGNQVRFWITSSGTWGSLRELTSSQTVGTEWTHIAATYDGNKMEIYIDGIKDTNAISTTITMFSGTAPLMFGVHPAYITHGWVPGYFKGIIDEVSIWDEALTPDRIAWLPPVTNEDFALKNGTTLPLKFQVFDGSVLVTTPQPVSLNVTGPAGFVKKTYVLGEGVENLRWNADESYYIANLKTKDGTWPEGSYTATVGGIVTNTTTFELSAAKGVGRGNSGK